MVGRCAEQVVLDNLKAAVVKACFNDPLIPAGLWGCTEHYGFLISTLPSPRARVTRAKWSRAASAYVERNFITSDTAARCG